MSRFARAAALAMALACAADAFARPGGGGSFHSSSHSYSSHSGGGGGGGEFLLTIVMWLLQLCVEVPVVGIPLTGGILALVIWLAMRSSPKPGEEDWSTGAAPAESAVNVRHRLEALRAADPEFSLVLFQDFLYALYAEANQARGGGKIDRLSPWLSAQVRERWKSDPPAEVKNIVVGALHLRRAADRQPGVPADVEVEFEANLTEVRGGAETSWYQRDVWRLRRPYTARSRPPEKVRVFGCPNCGAALEAAQGSVCTYCKQVIDTGEFDWQVVYATTVEREAHGPQLTGDPPEVGTDLPTVIDPEVAEREAALLARDPKFSREPLFARARLIFDELQVAWSEREWLRARPFVSDRLFQMQLYWIDAYKKAHLRNITERARVTRIEVVRVTSDQHYDAITLRLFATGLDYTIYDTNEKLVAGSRSRERPYSEYWTLIRGASATGAARADKRCPGCGADLKINMAGVCEFCRARVASGEFDWVLSQIEQDEVYQG